jgi:hypothetical protein
VQRRILFGVVAWLLGAATATAGSLLASSLLGQGITGSAAQLLTQDAVNRALASESAEPPADTPGGPAAARSATPSPDAPTATTAPPVTASPAVTSGPVQDPATATAGPSGQADGTVLTSAGGNVVASCQASGAYLISWSPSQGYEVSGVNRGPASAAQVTFYSSSNRVTMVVSCSTGVPTATSHTSWGGDD